MDIALQRFNTSRPPWPRSLILESVLSVSQFVTVASRFLTLADPTSGSGEKRRNAQTLGRGIKTGMEKNVVGKILDEISTRFAGNSSIDTQKWKKAQKLCFRTVFFSFLKNQLLPLSKTFVP